MASRVQVLQALIFPQEAVVFALWRGVVKARRHGARRFKRLLQTKREARDRKELDELVRYVRALDFSGLRGAEPWRVEEVCQCLKLRFFEKGEVLFRRGDSGQHVYIIVDGIAAVYTDPSRAELSKGTDFVSLTDSASLREHKGFLGPRTSIAQAVDEEEVALRENDAKEDDADSERPLSPERKVYRDRQTMVAELGSCLARRIRGNSFGELSMMDDRKRGATVVAEEPLLVFTIERDEWRRLLLEPFAFERREKLDVLCRCAAFRHYGLRALHAVADFLVPHHYPFQTELLKQGERPDHVHLVTKGTAELVRYYDDPVASAADTRAFPGSFQTPGLKTPGPASSTAALKASPLNRAVSLLNVAPRSGRWRIKLGVAKQGDAIGQYACMRKASQWCSVVAKDLNGCSTYSFFFLDFYDRLGSDVRFDLDNISIDSPIDELVDEALLGIEQWALKKRVVVNGSLTVKKPKLGENRTSDVFDRARNDVRLFGPPARTMEDAARPLPSKLLVPPRHKLDGSVTPWRRAKEWNTTGTHTGARSQSTTPGPPRRGGGGGGAIMMTPTPSSRKKRDTPLRSVSRLATHEEEEAARERFEDERAAMRRFAKSVGPFRSPGLAKYAGVEAATIPLSESASEPGLSSLPRPRSRKLAAKLRSFAAFGNMTPSPAPKVAAADNERAATLLQVPGQLDLSMHIDWPKGMRANSDFYSSGAVLTISFEGGDLCLMHDGDSVENATAVFYVAATTCEFGTRSLFVRWSAGEAAIILLEPDDLNEAAFQLAEICVEVATALRVDGLLNPETMCVGNGTRMRFGLATGNDLFLTRQSGVQFVRHVAGHMWSDALRYSSSAVDLHEDDDAQSTQKNRASSEGGMARARWQESQEYTKSLAAVDGWLLRTSNQIANMLSHRGFTFMSDGSASALIGGENASSVWDEGVDSAKTKSRLLNKGKPLDLSSGTSHAFRMTLQRRMEQKRSGSRSGSRTPKTPQSRLSRQSRRSQTPADSSPPSRQALRTAGSDATDAGSPVGGMRAKGGAVARILTRRRKAREAIEGAKPKPLTPSQIKPESPSANLSAIRKWQRRASLAVLGLELYRKIHPNADPEDPLRNTDDPDTDEEEEESAVRPERRGPNGAEVLSLARGV